MNEALFTAGGERGFEAGSAYTRERERDDAVLDCRVPSRGFASRLSLAGAGAATLPILASPHAHGGSGSGRACMSAADSSMRMATARKVVLIVEDEPLLLVMASDMIEDAGFDVVTAANADEALLALRARADVRIMFTDIRMPGSMDGLALAATVRDHFPPVEIVVTSGHERPLPSQLPTRGLFLPKPYQERELVAVMQSFST